MRTALRTGVTSTAVALALVGAAGARADGLLGGLAGAPAASQPSQQAQAPLSALLQTATAPLQATAPTTAQTLTQTVQPVTGTVQTLVADTVQSVAQPVTTLTQPLQPVTAAVSAAVANIAQGAAQPVRPVTAPIVATVAGVVQPFPATPASIAHGVGTRSAELAPPTLASAAPTTAPVAAEHGTQPQPAPASIAATGRSQAAALPESVVQPARGGAGPPSGTPLPLGPAHAGSSPADSEDQSPAVAAAPAEVVPDPWLAPSARTIPAPASDVRRVAGLPGLRLVGLDDATGAIRFGLFWVAALFLALGAAPARTATMFRRWPSRALDRYRPYALGVGFALLAGVAITAL